ncbi:LapA family protein [Rhodococcus sp. Z13]|uniref:LapA family protein n=1 Tax=Rhodococcus sacchari TaxID=2962047 RepID=A0ACD4DD20_9NOCA|nr:LapA family protein [Rhodococcus sp. Z13]UYP17902.1 LapA family protein [Rhodococcus sp. Z13]
MSKKTTTLESGRSIGPLQITPRTIVAALLVVAAAVFILQNRNSTSIDLLWISVQAPLWLVLVVVFAAGWLAGTLFRRKR